MVMLALYKLNEVSFEAIVVYPREHILLKTYNFESLRYEYRKNSFMRFIPSEKNKNYKIFNETGFYRSTINNVTDYYKLYDTIKRDKSVTKAEQELWLFAMYYDFMSYIAQRLGSYQEHGQSEKSGRLILKSVVSLCFDVYNR